MSEFFTSVETRYRVIVGNVYKFYKNLSLKSLKEGNARVR